MSPKKSFALLGNGAIGKKHRAAIEQCEGASLVAIVDKYNVEQESVPVYSSLEEMLSAGINPDIVSIATPNGLHFEQAKQALDLGFHVLVEKPIVLNSEELKILLKKAKEKNRRIFNMLQLRLSPLVQWVKKALDEKMFGEIFMLNVQCYWNRNNKYYLSKNWHGTQEMDGGVVFTQFSHFVDVMHYWLGELNLHSSASQNFSHQKTTHFSDSGVVQFGFLPKGIGTLVYTTATFDKNFDSTITLIAEKASLQIGGQYMDELRYLRTEKIEKPVFEKPDNGHLLAYQELVSAMSQDRESVLDAKNAQKVIRFIEKIS